MVNKKFKRVLSLGLVCLMFTPIISFATAKNQSNVVVNNAVNNGPFIVGEVDTEELSEEERQKLALEEAVVEKADEIYGHKYIASNGKVELYLKEKNCSILIRDVETGAILKSTVDEEDAKARKYNEDASAMINSGIAFSVITLEGNTARRTAPVGVKSTALTYDIKDDGFKVSVVYATEGISFDVEVKLDDEGLKVHVPYDSIKEEGKMVTKEVKNPDGTKTKVEEHADVYIGDMYIFNGLGMTEKGDRDGYMILPDGNGIKVDYDDNFYIYAEDKVGVKYSSGYLQRVYGKDFSFDISGAKSYDTTDLIGTSNSTESIIAPYWGMVHNDTQFAVLGIITKGETSARIEGNFNGVANLYENYAGCRLIYRDVYKRSLSDTVQYQSTVDATCDASLLGDTEVEFLFTSGEKANYIGLAESYRNKLIADGDLVKTSDGTFKTRVDFFGVDKEEFLVFKTDVVATTVENVEDILADLNSKGVDNVLAIYTGWQKGGIYETPIYKYDVAGSIGGNKAMNDLVKKLKGTGNELYLMTDMQTINKAVTSSNYDAVKGFGQRTEEVWSPFLKVYQNFRYLIPELSNEYMIKLSEDMKADGLTNVAFSGISSQMFAYFRNDTQYSRDVAASKYTDALQKVQDSGMNVVLEKPFKYLWKYTDSFIDMPLYSSMFVYASDDIPFLSSVLKGTIDVYSDYVNFEANSTEYFLKLVETGVYPSFLITNESPTELLYTNSSWIYSSQYSLYDERIADYHAQLKAINDKVGDSVIVAHEKVDGDISITTYSNGVKVYVNFAEKAKTVDGMTLEALSYKVGEAE